MIWFGWVFSFFRTTSIFRSLYFCFDEMNHPEELIDNTETKRSARLDESLYFLDIEIKVTPLRLQVQADYILKLCYSAVIHIMKENIVRFIAAQMCAYFIYFRYLSNVSVYWSMKISYSNWFIFKTKLFSKNDIICCYNMFSWHHHTEILYIRIA